MNQELVDHLLYECETEQELLSGLQEITDEETLFAYLDAYNWDDGFAVPEAAAAHPCCTLPAALMLFYDAGGAGLFLPDGEPLSKRAKAFVKTLQTRILAGDFPAGKAAYVLPLTRTERFYLKKAGADPVFLTDLNL